MANRPNPHGGEGCPPTALCSSQLNAGYARRSRCLREGDDLDADDRRWKTRRIKGRGSLAERENAEPLSLGSKSSHLPDGKKAKISSTRQNARAGGAKLLLAGNRGTASATELAAAEEGRDIDSCEIELVWQPPDEEAPHRSSCAKGREGRWPRRVRRNGTSQIQGSSERMRNCRNGRYNGKKKRYGTERPRSDQEGGGVAIGALASCRHVPTYRPSRAWSAPALARKEPPVAIGSQPVAEGF